MKKWAIASGLLFCCAFGWAQRFLGGSFSASADHKDSPGSYDYTVSTFDVFINPTFGKANHQKETGFALLLGATRRNENFRNNGIKYEDISNKISIGIEPFFRKKKQIFEKCHVFGEISMPLLYVKGVQKFNRFAPSSDKSRETSFGLGLRGGFFYRINQKWRAEAQFGVLKAKLTWVSINQREADTHFQLQSQLNSTDLFRFGLSYFLQKTAKPTSK